MINKVEVVSSNVARIGWDNNSLYVDFKNGSYEYKNVPKRIYNEMLEAESKGKYLNAHVKGRYEYKRLG